MKLLLLFKKLIEDSNSSSSICYSSLLWKLDKVKKLKLEIF